MNSKQDKHSLSIGQVVAVYKDRYLVENEDIKTMMQTSGRYQYTHYLKADFPQIGDFVKFRLADDTLGIIEQLEERKSALIRTDVGKIAEPHVLAANIDICFLCMSMNKDFNLRKMRDFLTLTYDGNFQTIMLLTKSDLCEDIDYYINETKTVTDNEIIPVSAYHEDDMMNLKQLISNKTAVFIGSSGVGKSTLINQIIGEEHFKTNSIRLSDAQGRHTTVNRELIRLDNGGALIDTPGIRVISSYFVSEEQFEDILALSEGCRFDDCTHHLEPGCMVKTALNQGILDPERYRQYEKALKLNRFNKNRELQRERMYNRKSKKGR